MAEAWGLGAVMSVRRKRRSFCCDKSSDVLFIDALRRFKTPRIPSGQEVSIDEDRWRQASLSRPPCKLTGDIAYANI